MALGGTSFDGWCFGDSILSGRFRLFIFWWVCVSPLPPVDIAEAGYIAGSSPGETIETENVASGGEVDPNSVELSDADIEAQERIIHDAALEVADHMLAEFENDETLVFEEAPPAMEGEEYNIWRFSDNPDDPASSTKGVLYGKYVGEDRETLLMGNVDPETNIVEVVKFEVRGGLGDTPENISDVRQTLGSTDNLEAYEVSWFNESTGETNGLYADTLVEYPISTEEIEKITEEITQEMTS